MDEAGRVALLLSGYPMRALAQQEIPFSLDSGPTGLEKSPPRNCSIS
jgi:hypothetical protein